jgi:O-antigen/teichoic acid export membrane protein/glycosyltransferase involved in cell wall biosynthesis
VKRPLRVVHCPVNTAGVPWTNVQALRRRGVDASLVVFNRYTLHSEADRSLDLHGGLVRRQIAQWRVLAELLPQTDLFHFTFGLTLVPQSLQFPILRTFGKRSVMHYLGSDIRGKTPEELAYGKKAGAEIVGSYDAIRWVPEATVIPPGVDLTALTPAEPSGRRRPVVVHAPSSRRRKGTDHVVQACSELDVELRIVEGLHHDEALERYRDADIVVDQLNAGWYGLFAIECMALGKPVVTFLHDEAIRRTEQAYGISVPIVNASADTLGARLAELVELGPGGRREIGNASRAYVERVHDLDRVTDQLLGLYATVTEGARERRPTVAAAPPVEPAPALPLGDADLDGTVPSESDLEPLPMTPPAGLGRQLRRLGRHSAIYGIGGLVSRVIAVLLLPLYTHYLTPADYGKIETLLALTTIMGLILRAGITSAFFRFYFDVDDDAGRLRVLRTSFWFTMGGGTLGLVVLLLLAEPISSLLFGTSGSADLVRAAGVALWATVNYEQMTALFRVEERSVAFVCASLANVFLTIGLTLLLVVELEKGPLGVIVGNFSGTLIVYLALLGYRREQLGLQFDRGLLREMNRFGIPLVPTALFLWVTNFSDRFFLVKLADVAEAGIYSVGVRVASAMVLLLTAFRMAWPAFAYSIKDDREARRTYAYVLTYLTVITAWVALALTLLSPWLVDVLTSRPRFSESSRVVGPLAFSAVAYAAYIVVAIGVGRVRRTQFNWLVTGVAAAVNVALNLALIPLYGMMGAAIATVAAYTTMAVGMAWWSQRLYPVPYQWRRVVTAAAAAVGLAAAGKLLDEGLPLAVALIASYPLALVLLGFTTPAERRRLTRLVTRLPS